MWIRLSSDKTGTLTEGKPKLTEVVSVGGTCRGRRWIAIGTGTDVAMEGARLTLVKGDLRGIAHARRLSKATMRNIRQNLFLAFVYNALGVPVAAGVLYPVIGLLISPIWASAAMTLSSVSVIGNALRLRRIPAIDARA